MPCQKRGMRGKRERHRRNCVLEPHALGGKLIQVGSVSTGVPVATDPVGAQGVDRDQ